MNDLRLLADGAVDDPAAVLLRSARADNASPGSKDRMRVMLGIVDLANEGNSLPLRVPSLTNGARHERAKRLRKIAPFIPFQNLISPPKPASTRKFGVVVVASVQVAAILAALFVRPVPRLGPVNETVTSRHDEPEVSFIVPKVMARGSKKDPARLSERGPKASTLNKGEFGAAISSRPALVREPAPLTESIVGEEHAGVLAQKEETAAKPIAPLTPELSRPVIFQSGMTQPVRITGSDPSYPISARLRGVKGTVIVRCVLTEKGLAQNCIVLKSPAYLDEAVLSVAHTWRFTPVMWQGRPVSVNYIIKYNFKLG